LLAAVGARSVHRRAPSRQRISGDLDMTAFV
jgi:hypothetical protein